MDKKYAIQRVHAGGLAPEQELWIVTRIADGFTRVYPGAEKDINIDGFDPIRDAVHLPAILADASEHRELIKDYPVNAYPR